MSHMHFEEVSGLIILKLILYTKLIVVSIKQSEESEIMNHAELFIGLIYTMTRICFLYTNQ